MNIKTNNHTDNILKIFIKVRNITLLGFWIFKLIDNKEVYIFPLIKLNLLWVVLFDVD